MPAFSLIAAAALAAPSWSIGINDYPDKAFVLEKSAAVLADVVVDPKGRMTTCTPQEKAGAADLADAICPLYLKKKHRPARFADGSPAWFVEKDVYRMFIPGTSAVETINRLRRPDAIFGTAYLPTGMTTLDAKLVVAVDETGTITDCGPDIGDKPSVVTQEICARTGAIPRTVFRDPAGAAVKYVSRIRVRLQRTSASVRTAPDAES